MAAGIRKVTVATVRLWGRDIGAVAWDEQRGVANFEYEPVSVWNSKKPSHRRTGSL